MVWGGFTLARERRGRGLGVGEKRGRDGAVGKGWGEGGGLVFCSTKTYRVSECARVRLL